MQAEFQCSYSLQLLLGNQQTDSYCALPCLFLCIPFRQCTSTSPSGDNYGFEPCIHHRQPQVKEKKKEESRERACRERARERARRERARERARGESPCEKVAHPKNTETVAIVEICTLHTLRTLRRSWETFETGARTLSGSQETFEYQENEH